MKRSAAERAASGSALRPTTLAQLIRLTTLAEQPNLRSVALDMPIAGLTGTLSDRYTRSPTRGLVRAKTGSLSHVTGLAGTLVDADGKSVQGPPYRIRHKSTVVERASALYVAEDAAVGTC